MSSSGNVYMAKDMNKVNNIKCIVPYGHSTAQVKGNAMSTTQDNHQETPISASSSLMRHV